MHEIVGRVIRCIEEIFANKNLPIPQLAAETSLGDSLGLTSLDYAELVVRLEVEFGKDPMMAGELPDFRTVGDLARLYSEA